VSAPSGNYEVLFTADAKDDVASLDDSIRRRLKKALEAKLAANPSGYGSPLGGKLVGYWKHEFASHRVIYRIYEEYHYVVVCAVGKRQGVHASDVYQQFAAIADAGRVADQLRAVLAGLAARTKPKP
jgi:mRNA interferase RelE/StbE